MNGNPVNATDRTGLICGFGACVTGAVVAYRGYQAYRAYRSIRAAAAAARAAAAAVARARAPLTLGLAAAATQICSIANILSTMSPIASLPQGVLNEGAGDTEDDASDDSPSTGTSAGNTPGDDDNDPQKKGRPRDRRKQQEQVRDAGTAEKLTKPQRNDLGDAVEYESRRMGRNLGYQEIREIAKGIKSGTY